MPTINRYTELTPSRFNPLSMQEIMAVPLYKQSEYDKVAAANAMLQGALKPDPLKEHEELALKTKQDFDKQVELQSALLAKTGDFTGGQSEILKLKRQYDDLNAPTGTIGRINAAKQAEAAAYKSFMESDSAKTNSDEVNQMNWQKFRSQYTGFADPDKKMITNIGQLSAVKNRTLEEELKDLKGLLGEEVVQDLSSGKGSIYTGADGLLYTTNRSGRRIKLSNDPNLRAGIASIGAKLADPNSDFRKSIIYRGEDPNSIIKRLGLAREIMRKEDLSDTRSEHLGVADTFGVYDKSGDEGGAGQFIQTGAPVTSDAVDITDYSKANDLIKTIGAIPENQRTPAQQEQYTEVKELHDRADLKLKGGVDPDTGKVVPGNATYKALQKQWEAKGTEIKEYAKTHGLKLNAQGQIIRDQVRPDSSIGQKISALENQRGAIAEKRSAVKDAAWKESSSLRHTYAYVPTTPKEVNEQLAFHTGVKNALSGSSNLQDQLDIKSISLQNGTSTSNINTEDITNIKELIKSGDIVINDVKTFGEKGVPELTMTITPGKDAETYNADGVSFGNDDYGGEGKPVTIKVKMKPLSNSAITGGAAGFNNLNGAIANFYRNKGGVNQVTGNKQGEEVHGSLLNNAYRNFTNAQLANMSVRDNNAREALLNRADVSKLTVEQLLRAHANKKL
jgi:hypothetical protein